LGTVAWSGFVTSEQLTPEEAQRRPFQPMPEGTPWGAKWEYAWFKAEVTLPAAAAGQRIALRVEVGGESAIFVDGLALGARDRQHTEVTLAMRGVPGTRYAVLVECYAGHGPRLHYAGPIPPGRESVPEPPAQQVAVGRSTIGIWEEEAYQLYMDVETLYGLYQSINPNSLRVAEIAKGLRDFTTIVDFELPYAERVATFTACRARLKPLLACQNGSTNPTMIMFGHSHIDVAWLWPLAETERKCARTLGTQLALLKEYPEYKYLQSQTHLFRMTQRRYPELYARVKEAVKAGQVLPEGGMWVEADTNISSGESLIRQFIHGKRYFQDEFGVTSEMLWLPDVFGYSGAMPQIMRGCGIQYFATAKIFWQYNGGEQFPYNTFVWEGIDGSEVLTHLCNDYNSTTDTATVIKRWDDRVQKDGFSARLFPFGYGDGGGGPTRDHLEYIRRMSNLEGVPLARIASPIAYFKEQEAQGKPEARYVGELYFQAHRGTYTSQARTKRGNRKSELALREAELWGAAARALKGTAFPLATMDEAWKIVLLNQFHDIIPGSSIQRVYEEAEAAYAEAIRTAQQVTQAAQAALGDGSKALTVYNSLSWERCALVPLPQGWAGASNAAGEALLTQNIGGINYVELIVPPCGWTTLFPTPGTPAVPAQKGMAASARSLENELLRLTFNGKGEITSIWDKEAQRELAAGVCGELRMYKDVPTNWDAWDLDSMYPLTPVALDGAATVEVVSAGALAAVLRVKRQLHASTFTQEITLRRGSRRVEFHTVMDWQESHKMLKAHFPVAIHANEGIQEIQFGHIRRPNHKSRPFDADRFEVANHKWTALAEEQRGCAVLNDCKYGVNVLGNSINLTLLKSALAPDMTADKGRQEFTYAFYAWNGSFAESALVREGYELNCPATTTLGAAGTQALFSLSAPNVIIETVKPAEDGSSDIVVRLYEAKRTATRCTLTTPLPVRRVVQTNMLEEVQGELPCAEGAVTFELRPFEVKTLRLSF
jgi:alpha-mannosidase